MLDSSCDLLIPDDSDDQTLSTPADPVSPFESYDEEFDVTTVPEDMWLIGHRDSDDSALLGRVDTDPILAGQQWQVAHSICSGVAAFSTLQEAECYIATLLRRGYVADGPDRDGRPMCDHETAGRD